MTLPGDPRQAAHIIYSKSQDKWFVRRGKVLFECPGDLSESWSVAGRRLSGTYVRVRASRDLISHIYQALRP